MERTSDFERLLLLYKTEGKGISLEQYNINNGVIAPLIDGTTSGKNETDLHKYLIGMSVNCFSPTLLGRTEEGLPFLKFSDDCRDYAQMPGLLAID